MLDSIQTRALFIAIISFSSMPAFAVTGSESCAEIKSIRNREGLPHVSIEQVMAQAVAAHPLVEKSKVAVENSYSEIVIAKAVRFPQLSVGYDFTHTKNPTNNSALGEIEPQSYGVSLSFMLFDFGSSRHQIAAAKARHERSQYALVSQSYAIALSAADSYLDVLQQRLALDYARHAYDDLSKIKHALIESGFAKDVDINTAWQTKEGICLTLRTFFNEHQKATSYYASIVNVEPEDFYLEEPDPIWVNMNIEESIASAESRHPAFAGADAQLKDAGYAKRAAYSERYPRVVVSASTHNYHHHSRQFGDRERDGGSVGVRVNMPLFTGGRINANIAKARGAERMAQLDRETLMRTTRRQIRDLVQALQISESKADTQTSVVQTSQKLYENHLAQFNANLANKVVDSQNVINVVNERSKFYKAQVELNAMLFAVLMDRYNLLAQQGLLFESIEK